MKNIVERTCALLTVLTLLACQARKGPEVEGGGMDGGGGTIVFHSREKVIEILEQVWAQFAVERLDNPIIRAFEDVSGSREEDPEKLHIRGMLRKITGLEDVFLPTLRNQPERVERLPFMSLVASKKLKLLESGYCDSPEHKRSTASVSKLDQSGEVCVSLQALMRSATSGLRADLIALMAHEIGHLYGFGETDCQRLQRYFLDNMSVILRTDGRSTKNQYLNDLAEITSRWRILLHFDFIPKPGPEEVRLANDLRGLRHRIPRPYGADDLHLAHPENYERLYDQAANLSHQYDQFIKDLRKRMGNLPRVATDANAFAEMRRIGRLMLDFEVAANEYVGQGGGNDIPSLERHLFLWTTEPEALTEPNRRRCIETREQLERNGPEHEEDCLWMQAKAAERNARAEAE